MDSIFSKGLPKSAASYSPAVGSVAMMPELGPKVRLADHTEWLRSGFIVPKAGYGDAAKVTHLGAHTLAESASATPGSTVTSIATNGLGTYVACFGSTTQVYTSTDYGATWTLRAHNQANALAVRSVCWTGTRFVAVGNSSTIFGAATSTDGITWATSTIATVSGYTADTSDIAWDSKNNLVIAACQSNSVVEGIVTSPTGLTTAWTTRAPAQSLSSPPKISTGPVGVANWLGAVILHNTSQTAHMYSTDGTTWAAMTLPSASQTGGRAHVFAGRVLVPTAATGDLMYSLNFTTWFGTTISQGVTSVGNHSKAVWMRNKRVWVTSSTGQFIWSEDGINIYTQLVAIAPEPAAATINACVYAGDGLRATVAGGPTASSKMQYAISTFSSPNAVGVPAQTSMYVRIK